MCKVLLWTCPTQLGLSLSSLGHCLHLRAEEIPTFNLSKEWVRTRIFSGLGIWFWKQPSSYRVWDLCAITAIIGHHRSMVSWWIGMSLLYSAVIGNSYFFLTKKKISPSATLQLPTQGNSFTFKARLCLAVSEWSFLHTICSLSTFPCTANAEQECNINHTLPLYTVSSLPRPALCWNGCPAAVSLSS